MNTNQTLATLALGGVCLLSQPAALQAENPAEENSIGRRLESVEHASTFVTLLKNTDNSNSNDRQQFLFICNVHFFHYSNSCSTASCDNSHLIFDSQVTPLIMSLFYQDFPLEALEAVGKQQVCIR